MAKKIINILCKVFLGVLVIGVLALLLCANPWAENKLKKALAQLEQAQLKISYADLHINLFSGALSISDVEIKGRGQYHLLFKKIEVNGLGIFSYLLHNRISFNTVNIKQPHITYTQTQDTVSTGSKGSKKVPQLRINSLQLENGIFIIENKGDDPLAEGQFNISIKQITVDSSTGPHAQFGVLKLSLGNVTYKTKNDLYKVSSKHIYYDSREEVLRLDSIHFRSDYEKFELANAVNHEIDWLDIYIPSVKMSGLSAEEYLSSKAYLVNTITIDGADVFIFRDKRLPFPKKPDTKLLFETVTNFQPKFAIDTIRVKRGSVEYQEFTRHGTQPGKVTFRDLQASLYGLTNIDSLLRKNNYKAYLNAEAKVMGKSLLQASFSLPLAAHAQPATVSGNLNAMDMSAFNPMIGHVGSIRFEDGRLLDLSFEFNYNSQKSNGEMLLEYRGLKIRTLNNRSKDSTGLGQDIKSWITNHLIIETDNLKTEDDFRIGKISFTRNTKKSIFNYWWKSLLTGFQSSTGLKAEE